MRELNIIAVGSSPLIAAEIQRLIQDILGDFFTVATATTDSLQEAAPDTFYICANTQGMSEIIGAAGGQIPHRNRDLCIHKPGDYLV